MDWQDFCYIGQGLIMISIVVIVGMGLIIGLIAVIGIPMAQIECRLYNARFDTHYTTSEFFWAGDTIKNFLNTGEQKTLNVNVKKGE